MKHNEILDYINKIELKFPVHTWDLEGIKIWPYIRIKLAFIFYQEEVGTLVKSETDSKLNEANWLSKKLNWKNRNLKHKLDDIKLKRALKGAEVLFISFQENRVLLNNKYYNKSTDPIAEEIRLTGRSTLTLEFSNKLKKSLIFKSNKVLGFDDYINRRSRIGNVQLSLNCKEYDYFLSFLNESKPQSNFDSLKIEAISNSLRVFYSLYLYYDKIFSIKGKLKYLFTSCYYDYRVFALNAVCHKYGIKIIELPHGTHGDTHAAYGKWMNVPNEGYSLLPDVFWCWSKSEYNSIMEWSSPSSLPHKPFLGGNPWIRFWMGNSKTVSQYQNEINKIKDSNRKYILFTLQPFSDLSKAIPDCLLDAFKYASDNIHLWIRLHPRQAQTSLEIENFLSEKIGKDLFTLTEIKELPLPILIKNCDLHVTIYSSTVLEASYMNKPSLVLNNGSSVFKSLITEDLLYIADPDADSIYKGIQFMLYSNKSKSIQEIGKNNLNELLN